MATHEFQIGDGLEGREGRRGVLGLEQGRAAGRLCTQSAAAVSLGSAMEHSPQLSKLSRSRSGYQERP